ncbi:MAG TPA: enoyl-CoA hydratase-related protein [Acidimicrobiales bacterium]|nr:enoyl-CoA hydratase-related protein [Acidimicrobiales bacterium]
MESIVLDRADGVVTLTLNRPEKRNAVTAEMWETLLSSFTQVAENPADRVLVVTGAGGAFCAGADLTDVGLVSQPARERMRRLGQVALALHRVPKPTIAKVDGVAVGAGCNLALGCDLVVASDRARFCEIFARRGLTLDLGGSWLLPRLVGLHRAKELALFADMVPAEEAERLGLVNRVVPHEELDVFVDDWARRLAAGPPLALATIKRQLDDSATLSMEQALEEEARAQQLSLATSDAAEAVAAFLQKREPRFEGR